MRTSLTILALLALAVGIWWLGAASPPPPIRGASAPDAPPADNTTDRDSSTTTTNAAGLAVPDRSLAANPRGTIRGRIVDTDRRPLANATVLLVHDGPDPVGPAVTTGDDGRFVLFHAPLGACAVRVEAPGCVTSQRGDLHPEHAAQHDVDVGDFVLPPALLYTGVVQSRGRPLAGARLTLRPLLGAPDTPTPLVQRTVSADDGTFVFAAGPLPPSTLEVTADGHRRSPIRRIDTAPGVLQIELEPTPRVRGRIVATGTGAAVANAALWLVPLPERVDNLRAGGGRGTIAGRSDRDGNFELEPPAAPWFAVEVGGGDLVPTISEAIASDAEPAPLLLRVDRGIAVHGSVTFAGEPVAGIALVLDDNGWPLVSAAFAADGVLRLPPCPVGSWRLRIDGERGARHEQDVLVQPPGPLQLTIALGAGSRLSGRVLGSDPGWHQVVARHESGLLRHGLRQADDSYAIDGLSTGRWQVWAHAGGDDWRRVATDQLLARLEHPSIVIGDGPARLDLQAPAQLLGSVRGRVAVEFAGGRVELAAADERLAAVAPMLRQTQIAADGTFVLEPVLPGEWNVLLLRPGTTQPVRSQRIVVRAGSATDCAFD
jgi:hypothetical protein